MSTPISIFWFRRDLRLHDNSGLFQALQSGQPVLPIFIFDTNILGQLQDKDDRRVQFIHEALQHIHDKLLALGSGLRIFHGTPEESFKELLNEYTIGNVYTNHDYEAYAINRDNRIEKILSDKNIGFHTNKDQVIFDKNEVVKDDGLPYTVFTPYSRKWKARLTDQDLAPHPSEKLSQHFLRWDAPSLPGLGDIGFEPNGKAYPPSTVADDLIRHYGRDRDIPGIAGTSKLGVHLRFGTISIRELARKARALSETYLNELIWRDFYHMITWHFPHVCEGKSFKPAYDQIQWRQDNGEFDKWCQGQTGYPIVDAGMRELAETGFMHNRVRMITASFLCKHLLLDWRLGEAWFAQKLLDFDFAANNGGWQWAAGSGCDAAPYFRIFNPYLQTKKFDTNLNYIRKWVPEFNEFTYPKPIVDHEFARKRCLDVYSRALKGE